MAKKDILAQLRSAIGQKITPMADSAPAPREAVGKTLPRERRGAGKPKPAEAVPRSGRGVQFYLEDADRKIIHGLAVWFASQDLRVSDSQIVKAAIRLAEAHQGAKL